MFFVSNLLSSSQAGHPALPNGSNFTDLPSTFGDPELELSSESGSRPFRGSRSYQRRGQWWAMVGKVAPRRGKMASLRV